MSTATSVSDTTSIELAAQIQTNQRTKFVHRAGCPAGIQSYGRRGRRVGICLGETPGSVSHLRESTVSAHPKANDE